MSLYHLYVHKQNVLIPTVCQTESGVYLDEAPVTIVEAKIKAELEQALLSLLSSDNLPVSTPDASLEAGSAILDLLAIKKWSQFEKQAVMYTIHKDDNRISVYITGRADDGMWKQEFQRESSFAAETPQSAIVGFLLSEIEKDIQDGGQGTKPLLLLPPSP